MEYIWRLGADLQLVDKLDRLCICKNTKYVQITDKGVDWLKRQQSKKNEVDA